MQWKFDRVQDLVKGVSLGLEFVGIVVLVIGVISASLRYLWWYLSPKTTKTLLYNQYRKTLGKSILLGLEFLVAADIVNSITVRPDLESIYILGLIVLIRTFLSFSLQVEISGKWPWRGSESKERIQ